MEVWRRDAFQDVNRFQIQVRLGTLRLCENDKTAVAGFGSKQKIESSSNQRMIPRQELKVLARQSSFAITSHSEAFGRQARKRIRQNSGRTKLVCSHGQFFDVERVMVENLKHEFIQSAIRV